MIEVTNQPPPLENHNLFSSDAVLRDAQKRGHAGWAAGRLALLGERLGTTETIASVGTPIAMRPCFKPFDRYGHRLDEVDFHPRGTPC